MSWVGNLQPNEMARDEGDEDVPTLTVADSDEKPAISPRRRKKVVTFASLADLAEIQALAGCEPDSQSLEMDKTDGSEEPKSRGLPDPSYYLNMPLEDYDATSNNVSPMREVDLNKSSKQEL